jgi:uncharacterized RDD family membrane protein YckC
VILHRVLTTEKVPITYRVAGLGSRFLAWHVDVLALVLLFLLGALFATVLEMGRAGLGQAVLYLWQFAVLFGYYLIFEWLWDGQTPGKLMVGIRVIRGNGTSLSGTWSALRNLVRFVDLMPGLYAVGFAAAAGNREQRRLGDLAADTLVVHVERRGGPVQAILDAESDRGRLALLRQRLTQLDREQQQTLLDLCLRRDQLRVAERARLFRAVSQYVQERLELAPAQYESDEKFVLNLAAVLGERN